MGKPVQQVLSDTLCACNCGQRTFIASRTSKRTGAVEGRPNRFLRGHQHRVYQVGKYYFHRPGYVPGRKSVS